MKQFLTENFKWIILIIVIVVVSNYLTATHYDGLSKKEKSKIQHQLDSLQSRYLEENLVQQKALGKLKESHKEDSLLNIDLVKLNEKDQKLIFNQTKALEKLKTFSNHVLLLKLDSAYEADTKYKF